MTKLRFSPDLSFPLDVVTQRLGFLGRIGSGKSYASMKLAELMFDAGAQFVALDPVGVWYGLRVDGAGAGLSVPVFGGLHGDVPLEPTAGALIADLIVDRALSCVVDVSQFEADTDKARFAAAFASRFFFRKKAAPRAVHLFLEECQEFVPQNPARGEERMLHDFTRLGKLGRNFGVGISLISQRPQEVNKKVLNLTECLLAFQMTGSHERKAIKEWITTVGADENILTVLPTLAVGVAHVYSPQWLRISKQAKCYEKRSADVSSTPRVDAAPVEAKPLTPVDLGKIREAMTATIEKAKADDPRELRKEIAALKKQIAAAPEKSAPRTVVDERAVARAVAAAVKGRNMDIASIQKRIRVVQHEAAKASAAAAATMQLADEIQLGITKMMNTVEARADVPVEREQGTGANHPTVKTGGQQARSTTRPPVAPLAAIDRQAPGVSGVEQRILNTLAGFEALGVPEPDKATVAAMVGYHPNAKSYANATGSLRSAGRIDYPAGGRIALTDAGRQIADNALPVSSIDELHRLWFDRLGNVAKRILEPVLAAYPDAVPVADVARAADYHPNAKSFANMKGRLRTLGLIDYPSSGMMVATDVLFPRGL